jgi:hypothetical protein
MSDEFIHHAWESISLPERQHSPHTGASYVLAE